MKKIYVGKVLIVKVINLVLTVWLIYLFLGMIQNTESTLGIVFESIVAIGLSAYLVFIVVTTFLSLPEFKVDRKNVIYRDIFRKREFDKEKFEIYEFRMGGFKFYKFTDGINSLKYPANYFNKLKLFDVISQDRKISKRKR